jgi:hypothetical protein
VPEPGRPVAFPQRGHGRGDLRPPVPHCERHVGQGPGPERLGVGDEHRAHDDGVEGVVGHVADRVRPTLGGRRNRAVEPAPDLPRDIGRPGAGAADLHPGLRVVPDDVAVAGEEFVVVDRRKQLLGLRVEFPAGTRELAAGDDQIPVLRPTLDLERPGDTLRVVPDQDAALELNRNGTNPRLRDGVGNRLPPVPNLFNHRRAKPAVPFGELRLVRAVLIVFQQGVLLLQEFRVRRAELRPHLLLVWPRIPVGEGGSAAIPAAAKARITAPPSHERNRRIPLVRPVV